MVRIPDIVEEKLTHDQRRVYDDIQSGPRGAVVGPLRIWLNNPAFTDVAQKLGIYCRYNTGFPARLGELAILVVVARWRAGLEFAAHARIATENGLGEDIVEAIRTGNEPRFEHPDEAIIYEASNELLTTRRLAQKTYDRVLETFGQSGLIDLVGILGYYTMIAMTVVTFEMDMPEGVSDPFPEA